MTNIALSISILSFTGILLLFAVMFSYLASREKSRIIVGKIRGSGPLTAAEEAAVSVAEERGLKKHFLRFVGALGNPLKPREQTDLYRMRTGLLRAGYRNPNAFVLYFGFKVFFAILFVLLFLAARVSLMLVFPATPLIVLPVVLAVAGFYLPDIWLRVKIAGRQEKITEGFPDALDLMVVCVESGMGLDAALTRVGEEMRLTNTVLSDEFRQLNLELRAGKQRSEALRNLALRTGLDDVSSLTTLLIQTDRFGTSVAQALRVHSDSMRTKRYQRAEEMAAKLPVKLVFPLILFIFPALFVVIVGPAAIKIMRHLLPAM